jgi:nicotinamide riboside kinase
VDPWVLEEIARRTYDLILLCAPDLPWQEDPLREHPELKMREAFFAKYLQLTKQSGFPFKIIAGYPVKRMSAGVEAIQSLE